MSYRRRILALALSVLSVSCLLVSGLTIYLLYQTALEQRRLLLEDATEMLHSLLEGVHRHELLQHPQAPQEAQDSLLGHILETARDYRGLGKTGGYSLARRQGDQIVFLVRRRVGEADNMPPLPWDSPRGEYMRRALQGQSGIIVAQDHRGVMVMAAYRPLPELGLGLVVKQDLEEIRSPFAQAGLVALAGSLLLAGLGAAVHLGQTAPLLRRLEESEARFRLTFDEAPLAAAMVGPDQRLIRVNAEFCRFLGYEVEELIGRTFLEITHPDHRREDKEMTHRLFVGQINNYQTDKRYLRKDGSVVWGRATVRLVRDSQGHVLYALPLIEDISRRKLEEAEREALVVSLQQALDNVRTLRGLIPICANCKKIRDDQGYWQALEAYLSLHTEAGFSHGICPDCMALLYPELDGEGKDPDRP